MILLQPYCTMLYCHAGCQWHRRAPNGYGCRHFSTNQCLARKTPCHLLAFELYYWYTHFNLPYIYIFQKKIAEEKEKGKLTRTPTNPRFEAVVYILQNPIPSKKNTSNGIPSLTSFNKIYPWSNAQREKSNVYSNPCRPPTLP